MVAGKGAGIGGGGVKRDQQGADTEEERQVARWTTAHHTPRAAHRPSSGERQPPNTEWSTQHQKAAAAQSMQPTLRWLLLQAPHRSAPLGHLVTQGHQIRHIQYPPTQKRSNTPGGSGGTCTFSIQPHWSSILYTASLPTIYHCFWLPLLLMIHINEFVFIIEEIDYWGVELLTRVQQYLPSHD